MMENQGNNKRQSPLQTRTAWECLRHGASKRHAPQRVDVFLEMKA